jgi:hypothetical protein
VAGLAAIAILFALLQLITILNRGHHFRGFVYQHACFRPDYLSIEIAVRPRKDSAGDCGFPLFHGVARFARGNSRWPQAKISRLPRGSGTW